MDRYEGVAHLEWWANRSTCLARTPVRLAATTDPGAWEAAMAPPPDDDTRDGIRFLIDLDPYFTLRLDDTAIGVTVEYSGDGDRLRLSEVSEPG